MRIVVYGCSGFIGKYFCKYAINKGNHIIGVDFNFPADEYFENNKYFNFISFSQKDDYENSIYESADAILCLASKRTTSSFTNDDFLYNIGIATYILDMGNKYNIKNITFISSQSVYSSVNYPWSEDSKDVQLNLYGCSKESIDIISEYYNQKYGFNIKCLRLAQVIGIGERPGYLLNTLINKANNKEKLTIYGKGVGVRQYIYIKDVIDCILYLMYIEKAKGIYNIGMDSTISIKDLALTINSVFNNEGNIEFLLDKEEDEKTYHMDVSKVREKYGWSAKYSLKEALVDIKKELGNYDK